MVKNLDKNGLDLLAVRNGSKNEAVFFFIGLVLDTPENLQLVDLFFSVASRDVFDSAR